MAQIDQFIPCDDIHPIDIVETVAVYRDWNFDRLGEDQIAMEIEGLWRSYAITLDWSPKDEMLRLVCSFDMDPPEDRIPVLYETLNLANDEVWDGAFTFWSAQRLMVWRYGLVLCGDAPAGSSQIDHMLHAAVATSERFYPALQMVCWGDSTPADALEIAMTEAYGRA